VCQKTDNGAPKGATPVIFAKSAETVERKRDELRECAKGREKSLEMIEKAAVTVLP
jgi:hypothetical protein